MEIYYDLNKKYFGDDIVVDELIAWSGPGSPTSTGRFMCTSKPRAFAAPPLGKQIMEEGSRPGALSNLPGSAGPTTP